MAQASLSLADWTPRGAHWFQAAVDPQGRAGVESAAAKPGTHVMPRKPTDEELDEELEDTFPASDPPTLTEPRGDARRREREERDEEGEAED
jgi:hypothetical protein